MRDERVEEDDEGLLVLVGESVDVPVEGVELGVLDLDLGDGPRAPDDVAAAIVRVALVNAGGRASNRLSRTRAASSVAADVIGSQQRGRALTGR